MKTLIALRLEETYNSKTVYSELGKVASLTKNQDGSITLGTYRDTFILRDGIYYDSIEDILRDQSYGAFVHGKVEGILELFR